MSNNDVILCGSCQKAINDDEYLAVTGPGKNGVERQADKVICQECAKKLYPELYDALCMESEKEDDK
jgi:uncharacterized CHY-type Zn-finger protein